MSEFLDGHKFSPRQINAVKISIYNRLIDPVSDKLLASQDSLEIHLRERERELFNLNRTIVLYDLTNSYFEGEASANVSVKLR